MTMWSLIKRNCKVYFKDKSVFLPSLITPLILLLLYVTFLRNVYIDSFKMALPAGVSLGDDVINGFVGGWLISSLLAVCCITVAFCANTIMVSDKASGSYNDLLIAPIKKSTLSLSYYFATAIVTGIICSLALVGGLIYLAIVGWYMSVGDILLLILDCVLVIMFGTALSAIITNGLKNLGAVSAICSIVSSVYGFICGAYMPMSQFGTGLRNILMCLPWTYGTGLIRTHSMQGVMNTLKNQMSPESISQITKNFDIQLRFFDNHVSVLAMYLVIGISVLILVGIYLFMNFKKKKKLSE